MDIANNLYSWFYKDQGASSIRQLSDNQILNIANDINGIFNETNLAESKPELTLPRLVVVGTQSSGKSSVLNAIMTIDIAPTGKNMVTRTPLDIRLFKLKDTTDAWVEFGHVNDDNSWVVDDKINIKMPVPTPEEVTKIRDTIARKTIEIAGEGMNISATPIIIKIYSPHVPNLSLIDLPGLTMVACVDKGQPADIKERIEDLVTSYIKQKRTIIIAVMQSRTDLETDIGLALIKKHDADGQRTVGVLTKPDLMNYDTHIGEYLTNSISKNLMLTYGYYVVRNRSDKESKETDIIKGYEMERQYFVNHPEYKKQMYRDRTGIANLTINLNKILVGSISELLPSVMAEMLALEGKVNKKLEAVGEDLPPSKDGKVGILNKYVSGFCSNFIDSVESRNTQFNTGKIIKDIFVAYRNKVMAVKPFNNSSIYNDAYFKEITSSFEGNHMSFHLPPVQLLEAIMTDSKHKPIVNSLKDISLKCVDDVCDALTNLLKQVGLLEEFMKYSPLSGFISSTIVDEIIFPCRARTKKQIVEQIKYEEDYIWTDKKEFAESLKTENIKNILDTYFTSVKDVVAHTVPKIIMSIIIRDIEKTMLSYLLHKVVSEDKIGLLKEDPEIEKQRKYYGSIRARIEGIKTIFSKNISSLSMHE
jgi:GTP-binding protein EngB required for normal cell division